MQEQKDDAGAELVKFSASLSTDRDGFVRRACGACGREFKTEAHPLDLQWALAGQCQRMGFEVGEEDAPDAQAGTLRCPFCGHNGGPADMHTSETEDYLQRVVNREYVMPMMNKWMSGLADSIGSGTQAHGAMSIGFSHSRDPLPPRPFHGPEPPDMKIVQLECCNKRVKVPEGWHALRACPYCQVELVLF